MGGNPRGATRPAIELEVMTDTTIDKGSLKLLNCSTAQLPLRARSKGRSIEAANHEINIHASPCWGQREILPRLLEEAKLRRRRME